RYAKVTDAPVLREARIQHPTDRQSSVECEDDWKSDEWKSIQEMCAKHAVEAYEWALDNGIAKEQARAALPEGMTVSRLFVSGSLRSWVHYIGLRSANGTQLEHQRIAVDC